MKIVILGDTHFGCGYSMGKIMPYSKLNSRLVDYSNTFDYVVDYMVENGVSHFVLTGDIFENRRPQASELSLFSEKIRRLEERGIYTHIVVGNHDLIREQRATTIDVLQKLKLPRTFIYPDVSSVACTENGNVLNVIFFPYRTKYMLDCTTNEEAIGRLSDRLQYELRGISNSGPKILVGHFMLQGTKLGNVVLDGSAGEVVLPAKMFDGLDAIVMGHIHPHQIVQRNPLITYVGSMERKDFGESDVKKYFLIVDLDDKNFTFRFEQLPVRSLYDITIDQSLADNGHDAMTGSIAYLEQYNNNHKLAESIVRITIFLNDKALFEFDRDQIKDFIKEKMKVSHCLSIHVQIVSKRQLRKDSITERKSPSESFLEYLELIEDSQLRERMKDIGLKIITEGSNS